MMHSNMLSRQLKPFINKQKSSKNTGESDNISLFNEMSILNFKNLNRLELIKLEQIFSNRVDGIVLLRIYEQEGDLLLPLAATLVDQNCLAELEKRFELSLLAI